jgi:hypothetical protein
MIATEAPSDDEMSAPRPAPTATAARHVGAVGHGALLLNPRSGGGKVGRFGLEDETLRRSITPMVLVSGGDLRGLAGKAVAAGADALGAAGGSVYSLLGPGFRDEAAALGRWLRDRVEEQAGGGGAPLKMM